MGRVAPLRLAVFIGVMLAVGRAQGQPVTDVQNGFGSNYLAQQRQAYGEIDVDGAAKGEMESTERSAKADASFDSIMLPQNAMPAQRRVSSIGDLAIAGKGDRDAVRPRVEVPLREFNRVRDALDRLRKEAERRQGPSVVLGAASYSGEVKEGALALTLDLRVTLGNPDVWKTVPLVGDDVVLVSATVGGKPLPVARRNGYHVWATQQTGEVAVRTKLLVPTRGPRGSIEYDFLVARTPVTTFSCRFPVPDLEPKLTAAVSSEVRPGGGSTTLTAALRPTTRIHLVGFRDLGDAEGRKAKVYAETTSLLSVDEGAVDLFSVIRYTILYAGTKEFRILVPQDWTVESADGEGAFRFAVEDSGSGTLLNGETAFPIRNNYEISLRLRRELDEKGGAFEIRQPQSVGVEREQGWLGVEATGKLRLQETGRDEALAIDVRQLPAEMIQSAVSPILKAYRYHAPTARVKLQATRLPEREPISASIDRVRAFSTISDAGQALTDLRITMRNRLRHSLILTLPEGAEVRSTLLDGEPVKPSRNEKGQLMLPLKRSAGRGTLEPFVLQVVLGGEVAEVSGLFGRPSLRLPSMDLPISTLAWSVHVPAKNVYTAPEGDIEPQAIVGTASWHQSRQTARVALGPRVPTGGRRVTATSADTGAMPVRIKLPERGTELTYNRAWIDTGRPIEINFWYVRGWLLIPIALALIALLAIGVAVFVTRWTDRGLTSPWLLTGLAAAVAVLWPLSKVASAADIVLGIFLGTGIAVWRSGKLSGVPGKLKEWSSSLSHEYRSRERMVWSVGRVFWRLALGGALLICGMVLLISTVRLIGLLFSPLAG